MPNPSEVTKATQRIWFGLHWKCALLIWMARERGFDVRVEEVKPCQN